MTGPPFAVTSRAACGTIANTVCRETGDVEQIEEAIEQLDVRDQVRLVKELPAHLSISADDIALLQLAESAFTFWDNPDDAAAYDSAITAAMSFCFRFGSPI